MSLNEFSDTVMIRFSRSRDLGLHVDEAVPAAQREPLVPALGGGDLEPAVDRDRVVDRAEHRDAELTLDEQQAEAEALVVLDDVEVVLAMAEVVPRPPGEREWLRERNCPPTNAVTSSTSFQFFSSQTPGCRIGKWSL